MQVSLKWDGTKIYGKYTCTVGLCKEGTMGLNELVEYRAMTVKFEFSPVPSWRLKVGVG